LQWRTWGARFIQVIWRRYREKRDRKLLREAEKRQQNASENEEESSSPSIGSTVYVQRFASNALKHLRSGKRVTQTKKFLPLLPQKPDEPDFITQKN
jgi:cyclic nucleotide gated channel, plant